MRFSLKIFLFCLFFVSVVNAQDLTREQKLQRIGDLKGQVKVLETELFLPDAKDLKQAEKEGFEVFRLMPRERFDGKLIVQGGGAYYSFTTKSHDYQKIPQIELSGDELSVGFAGADYGFMADLNQISLSDVTKETIGVNFLVNYKPPTNETEIRVEQSKAHNYEADGFFYHRSVPAKIGNSYILRAISFSDADVLVAFKVFRKDTDESLIIFWKLIENFEKPQIARN